MSTQLPRGAEDWDVEDSQSAVEPQFEDATVEEEEEDKEQVVIESVMEEELEQPAVGEPLTKELGEDTIDTISQDVMPIPAGEADMYNKHMSPHSATSTNEWTPKCRKFTQDYKFL